MTTVGILLLIACVMGICIGWLVPQLRFVRLAAATVLVAVAATLIWWGLLYFQIVRLEPMLRFLKIYRLEGITGALVFFGPPAAVAAAFAAAAWSRR